HHADDDAERRDERDHRDEGLLALGQEVSERDVEFERKIHVAASRQRPAASSQQQVRWRLAAYSRFRISGNKMTSRIDGLFVNSMTRRSIPTPSPAVGGRPYSSARM